MNKDIYFAAVCGVRNSGKTTLTEKIIRILTFRGLKTAVIKHDGHEFECDVPGTDSCRFTEAGAYGTAVFSKGQIFVRKKGSFPAAEDQEGIFRILGELISAFPEADVILAEGLKGLPVPKIEVVRSAVSQKPSSNPRGRFLVVSDLPEDRIGEKTLSFEDPEGIADEILRCAANVNRKNPVLPAAGMNAACGIPRTGRGRVGDSFFVTRGCASPRSVFISQKQAGEPPVKK